MGKEKHCFLQIPIRTLLNSPFCCSWLIAISQNHSNPAAALPNSHFAPGESALSISCRCPCSASDPSVRHLFFIVTLESTESQAFYLLELEIRKSKSHIIDPYCPLFRGSALASFITNHLAANEENWKIFYQQTALKFRNHNLDILPLTF